MKTSGYMLMAAIKETETRKKQLQTVWSESLFSFEGEQKADPYEVAQKINDLEEMLVRLQAAQDWYNSNISCTIDGKQSNLSMLVKYRGMLKRVAARWEEAAAFDPTRGRFIRNVKEEEYAKPRVDSQKALTTALDLNRKVEKVRVLMNRLNMQEIEVPILKEGDVITEDIKGV